HAKALEKLNEIGFRPFEQTELQTLFTELKNAIHIGISRKGVPTSEDGGLLAFPTGVTPITQKDVERIPEGTAAIVCACGGTNWIFTKATRGKNGTVKLAEPYVRPIPKNQRQHTFASLTELFATEIFNVAQEYNLTETPNLPIAVSFGFPQTTVRTTNGDIDARVNRSNLPKFWKITDCDESLPPEKQPSLSRLLRVALRKKGMKSIGRIVFVNDTVAVALDVQHDGKDSKDLPVGFVFGTGTNAAMDGNSKKGIINLEAGHAKAMQADHVFEHMLKKKLVPGTIPVLEYWMGGGYLPARIAGAIWCMADYFADPKQMTKTILKNTNQALVSEIAQGVSPRKLGLHSGPSEYKTVSECARRTLIQAGQVIGVMIATVCAETGYTKGKVHVPYEGSLLNKGYLVEKTAQQTIHSLLPKSNIVPYKACGMNGVAKLAMLLSQTKK
ncbi:MAG TPA: hypothetical protein VJB65_01215, partial [Patescibacteria group bacterium]|nr:hypothetical protein [Patescibacteria group bacterium]